MTSQAKNRNVTTIIISKELHSKLVQERAKRKLPIKFLVENILNHYFQKDFKFTMELNE
jgi:hypothetical protein